MKRDRIRHLLETYNYKEGFLDRSKYEAIAEELKDCWAVLDCVDEMVNWLIMYLKKGKPLETSIDEVEEALYKIKKRHGLAYEQNNEKTKKE